MSSRDKIVEEPLARVIEDKMYVAVGKEVKKSISTLLWALRSSGGRKLCILHVHQPAQMIPLPEFGTKLPASSVKEQEVNAYREFERQNMHEILDEYLLICHRVGVTAEKLYVEMSYVEKGIVELVTQHEIKKLVMGAAEDKRYSRKMKEIKSKKAIYVRAEAPAACHIWFICNGELIHTREGTLDGVDVVPRPLPLSVPRNTETQKLKNLRSRSVPVGQDEHLGLGPSNFRYGVPLRVRSEILVPHEGYFSPEGTGQASIPWSGLDTEGSSDECGEMPRSSSLGSGIQSRSSFELVAHSALTQLVSNSESKDIHLPASPWSDEDHNNSSPPRVLELKKSIAEAEISRQKEIEESIRCEKAEKEAIETFRRAKTSETLYIDELKQREEIEDALTREKENLEKIKNQRDRVMKELQIAINQKSLMESQLSNSDQMVKELEEKMASAMDLLQSYQKERDELQIERNNALREAEELRRQYAGEVPSYVPQFFSEFSFSEIKEATRNFDPSLKIGEGGYGSIYRGVLRHTEVAVKILHSNSSQGPSEYQQEVEVLSKWRHPNLVTLIGVCPETWTLIYEYVPNGSLEDRLRCRDNSAPLSWQTRIRIAAELCSVLIFLHSIKPHGIVHGDLKPSNILLDANFVSKLSDFGICREISQDGNSTNSTTLFCNTVPKGTFLYMDPEFLTTGELSLKSDVYSFGVILLQLLTGRPALGIAKEVQYAVDKGDLNALLDPLGGDWPFVQAKQLAHMALWCCKMNRESRPNFASDVWRVIEQMKVSSGSAWSFRRGSQEERQIPGSYICPIFQEVMQDPHVAADGYTYEAEAIRGWLDDGNDSSPMTSLKLSNLNLVPNRALRSAIQEWLQKH